MKPDASNVSNINLGRISAQVRYTETATRFGGRHLWALCPRCSRRCRVLYIGLAKVACRRCFRLRYHSQSMDLIGRAVHAMGKIARKIDPEEEMDLPDKPPGMHLSSHGSSTTVKASARPDERCLLSYRGEFRPSHPSPAFAS